METKDIALPTVHINGSSIDALIEQAQNAFDALHRASDAIIAAAPNARDYYPQGEGAYERALHQHRDRILKLAGISLEISAIWEHLQDQKDLREGRRPSW